jgi:hypothetical protein
VTFKNFVTFKIRAGDVRPQVGGKKYPMKTGTAQQHLKQQRADDFDLQAEGVHDGRDSSEHATATNGDDDGVEIGLGGEHFEADGALAGNDQGIVVRMDKHQPALRHDVKRVIFGLVEVLAVKEDLCSEACSSVHLDMLGVARHNDYSWNTQTLSVISNVLRVVFGGNRDDTSFCAVLHLMSLFSAPRSLKAPVYCLLIGQLLDLHN